MKELSIEEKAKAYDEAFEKAKMFHERELYAECNGNLVEYIFPALKESEDEKVRRVLREIVLQWKNGHQAWCSDDKEIDTILAWLEKQGKPIDKIVKRAMNEKQRVLLTETNGDANIDWDTRSLQDVKLLLEYGLDYIKKLEKQREQKPIDKIQLGKKYKCVASPRYSAFITGKIYKPEDKFLCSLMNFCSDCFEPIEDGEQKPIDKVEPKFKVGDKIKYSSNVYDVLAVKEHYYELSNGNVCEFKNQDKWQLVKQEPAWSEEDEYCIHQLIVFCENCMQHDSGAIRCANWLKSLKDRVQPKKELSEEDKTNIDSLLDVLYRIKKGKDPQATTRLIEQHINFIKSLRERYTWKPSDEQIKVLEFFIPYVTQCNVVLQKSKDTLLSLLSDLKKLKG